MAAALTAVALTGPPRVDLDGTGYDVATAYVVVTRLWRDTSLPVRSDLATAVVGGLFVLTDWDTPLDTPVTYDAVGYTAAGAVTGTASVTVTVPSGLDRSQAWLSDPLDPSTALVVDLADGTDEEISLPLAGELVSPMGRDLPMPIGARRLYGQGRTLVVETDTEAASTALEQMLTGSGTLLVRAPHVWSRNGLVYLSASVTVRPLHQLADHTWETQWILSGGEVSAPTLGVLVNPRTYNDASTEAATYAGLLAAWPTYRDLLRGI